MNMKHIEQIEEEKEELAWFNANNKISIHTTKLNQDMLLEVPDYIQVDLITAIKLKNQLTISINEMVDYINGLN